MRWWADHDAETANWSHRTFVAPLTLFPKQSPIVLTGSIFFECLESIESITPLGHSCHLSAGTSERYRIAKNIFPFREMKKIGIYSNEPLEKVADSCK